MERFTSNAQDLGNRTCFMPTVPEEGKALQDYPYRKFFSSFYREKCAAKKF
jgi:hypothetical protein